MRFKSFLFTTVLFISMNAMATPKDSAYTYRFSVTNHFEHPYLNFQLDSSWYFVKEYYHHPHFVYNEFVNPSLKEELNIIQLAADFSLAEAGKTKIPSKIIALNFRQVTEQYTSADYEQKMGFVQFDVPNKKAILNLKMLGIGKGFLFVYELHDQSTWMMWYPNLTDLKENQLNARIANADKMILESFAPTSKYLGTKEFKEEFSSLLDAEFKGGAEELKKFVQSNLEIPESLLENTSSNLSQMSNRVSMIFVIEKDGTMDDFYMDYKNAFLMPSLVNVSIQLYRKMPNWIPGSDQLGYPTRTIIRIPLNFEIF